jgi:hypothetical protein
MIEDIQQNHLRDGLARSDVHELLGNPDSVNNSIGSSRDEYGLGGCSGLLSGLPGDDALLRIYYRNQELVNTEIYSY